MRRPRLDVLLPSRNERRLRVARVRRARFAVCDVDADGFVTLLDDSTGETRADLQLTHTSQLGALLADGEVEAVAHGLGEQAAAIEALQDALADGAELVAVVACIDWVGPLPALTRTPGLALTLTAPTGGPGVLSDKRGGQSRGGPLDKPARARDGGARK